MRTLFCVVLFGVGSLALSATPARAQWDNDVCIDITSISELFDPNAFIGAPKCESLCAKSAGLCKKFAKAAASCQNTSFKGLYGFSDKTDCDTLEDPNDRKSCKADNKQGMGILKGIFASQLDSELNDCQGFEEDCLSDSCAP